MADSLIQSSLDILNRYGTASTDFDPTVNRWEQKEKEEALYKDKSALSFTDMLSLMVAQFQNQTIDNQADTGDMMNQLVQMSVVQAMTDMSSQMKELALANVMSYSASLVGQTVTIGIYDTNGRLKEFEGVVEGAGTYDGQQVIFIEGKSYALSSIMAVGKLPPRVDETDDVENKDDKVEQKPGVEDGEDAEEKDPDEAVNKTQGAEGT